MNNATKRKYTVPELEHILHQYNHPHELTIDTKVTDDMRDKYYNKMHTYTIREIVSHFAGSDALLKYGESFDLTSLSEDGLKKRIRMLQQQIAVLQQQDK